MANFSPSIQFARRWLGAPSDARRAIYEELDDIIELLDSQAPLSEFRFRHSDFNATLVAHMQAGSSGEAMRLVHPIDTTQLIDDAKDSLDTPDLQVLEARLTQDLSRQVDEFLKEHMAQLNQELKAWVATTVRNEMANFQRQ